MYLCYDLSIQCHMYILICALPLKHRQYENGRLFANSLLRAKTLLLSAESIQIGHNRYFVNALRNGERNLCLPHNFDLKSLIIEEDQVLIRQTGNR